MSIISNFFLRILNKISKIQSTGEVIKLLEILKIALSRTEIWAVLNLKSQSNLRARYLAPSLADGLIQMTIPDKPNSRFQKYCTTKQNKILLEKLKK